MKGASEKPEICLFCKKEITSGKSFGYGKGEMMHEQCLLDAGATSIVVVPEIAKKTRRKGTP